MIKDKLLIIGGTGFIGTHLTEEATKKNYAVTVLHFNKKIISKKISNVKYIQCNLNNKKKLLEILKKNKFYYIINASGYVDHSRLNENGKNIIQTHLTAVQNLIIGARDSCNIKNFIQLSSSDVYSPSSNKQKEDFREKPSSIYSYSKLSIDMFLQTLFRSEKYPSVIFRIFLTYGEYQKYDRLIPYIIKSALNNKIIKISNPNEIRDFIHVSEVTKVIISSLKLNRSKGLIINLASGKGIKIINLVSLICNYLNYDKIVINQNLSNKNKILIANIDKAKRLFRWEPKNNLKKDLERTIMHYQNEMYENSQNK